MTIRTTRTRIRAGEHSGEMVCLVILLLLAAVLRAWGFSRLGLTHFDEGVYAISGSWSQPPGKEFPMYGKQMLFAPPLYFILVGVVAAAMRMSADQAAIGLSILSGVATVALVWWVSRKWFGPVAGMASAALVAFSEFHIAFARAALTDVLFGFLFLLALYLVVDAIDHGSVGRSVLAGLACGAAWNTKYHGWLPVAIVLPVLLYLFAASNESRDWRRLAACWLVISLIALLCYLPWIAYIQSQEGGYATLARYQRKFLSLHWLSNLRQQAAQQLYLDGWLSRLSPLAALALAWAANRTRWEAKLAILSLAAALLSGGIAWSGAGVALGLTLTAVPALFRERTIANWSLLSALAGLFVLSPMYKPYARLLIPFSLCVAIAAGLGIKQILAAARERGPISGEPKRWTLAFCVIALAGGVTLVMKESRPAPRTWMPTESVRHAVQELGSMLPENSIIFVHGAPEVAYYLRPHSNRIVPIDLPIDHEDIESLYRPGGESHFLITGRYSRVEPLSRNSLQRLVGSRLQLRRVVPVQPGDVRLLDDSSPTQALAFRAHPTDAYDLHLYQIARNPGTEQERSGR